MKLSDRQIEDEKHRDALRINLKASFPRNPLSDELIEDLVYWVRDYINVHANEVENKKKKDRLAIQEYIEKLEELESFRKKLPKHSDLNHSLNFEDKNNLRAMPNFTPHTTRLLLREAKKLRIDAHTIDVLLNEEGLHDYGAFFIHDMAKDKELFGIKKQKLWQLLVEVKAFNLDPRITDLLSDAQRTLATFEPKKLQGNERTLSEINEAKALCMKWIISVCEKHGINSTNKIREVVSVLIGEPNKNFFNKVRKDNDFHGNHVTIRHRLKKPKTGR